MCCDCLRSCGQAKLKCQQRKTWSQLPHLAKESTHLPFQCGTRQAHFTRFSMVLQLGFHNPLDLLLLGYLHLPRLRLGLRFHTRSATHATHRCAQRTASAATRGGRDKAPLWPQINAGHLTSHRQRTASGRERKGSSSLQPLSRSHGHQAGSQPAVGHHPHHAPLTHSPTRSEAAPSPTAHSTPTRNYEPPDAPRPRGHLAAAHHVSRSLGLSYPPPPVPQHYRCATAPLARTARHLTRPMPDGCRQCRLAS